jgi:cell division transport system permease protein
MLPLLVAAMTFLAALALGGSAGAAALAQRWQQGAAAALTVQVPAPGDPTPGGEGRRLDAVLAALRASGGIADAHALSETELADLLRPWLGEAGADAGTALRLPGVIAVHLVGEGPDLAALQARLGQLAPGTLVESHGIWVARLEQLARSLQACAWLALGVVAAVAMAVVVIATRAGLAARRETIEVVHGLGASDGYIARRFAIRATRLAGAGGFLGALAAVPVLAALADLAAPFVTSPDVAPGPTLQALPPMLGGSLVALPFLAALIGFLAAQVTVRRWLKRLP